jgi:glutathione synthase/RimK-type ligase-like ATP-grasp enzyme
MNIKIAVHSEQNQHKDNYAARWVAELEKRDILAKKVNLRRTDAILQVRDCDGVMWHWFHMPDDKQLAPKILSSIELCLNIPVFPDLRTCWHYDEKNSQNYLFDAIDAPKIKTWVFWRYDEAVDFIRTCTYPVIFKLSVGAGSANILKVTNSHEAKQIVDKMFYRGFFPYTINEFTDLQALKKPKNLLSMMRRGKDALRFLLFGDYPPLKDYYLPQKNYVYLQEFLPNNPHDIRITVIGDRAFGYIRHNREDDFRASGSGNFDVTPENIPVDTVKIAHTLSLKNHFQSMAYDFLLNPERKPLISEISYCYVNWMVHECPGYWDRELKWHEGHMWPEEAHVEDFVNLILHRKTTRKTT